MHGDQVFRAEGEKLREHRDDEELFNDLLWSSTDVEKDPENEVTATSTPLFP